MRGENDIAVEDGKVQKMEEWLLCPVPSPSANRVRVHHAVRFVYISHVFIIVQDYGRFHSFSVLVIEFTLQWQRMHVCQYVYFSFVLPYYGCQVTLHLSLLDHPSSYSLYVQNTLASLFYFV